MIRFEFYTRKEQWVGSEHYRAWAARMQEVTEEFSSTDGQLVFYSFLSDNFTTAQAVASAVFNETKTALHQHGATELVFR